MSSSKPRILQLDILRGIAILLVLFRHAPIAPRDAGHFEPLSRALATVGWSGVDLFFVLSGFLIGGLLFQECKKTGKLDVRRFLVRRAFKIWPTYFAYLAFVLVYATFARREGSLGEVAQGLGANVLHLQNYLGSIRIHTWSLAVEEHFYLALPFLLVFLIRRGRMSWVPRIALGLMAACLAARIATALAVPKYDALVARYPTHLQIDALFLGVAVAYAFHMHPERAAEWGKRRGLLAAAGLLLVLPMTVLPLHEGFFVRTLGHTCLSLGYAALLVAMIHTPIRGLWKPAGELLAGIGVFSYSIYVWHHDLARYPSQWLLSHGWLESSLTVRWPLAMLVFIALSYFPAMLISKLVEMPALALRDRLFPARAAAVPVPDAPEPAPEAGVGQAARA